MSVTLGFLSPGPNVNIKSMNPRGLVLADVVKLPKVKYLIWLISGMYKTLPPRVFEVTNTESSKMFSILAATEAKLLITHLLGAWNPIKNNCFIFVIDPPLLTKV